MIGTDHLFRRLQVFVSSTFLDLRDEREDVRRALSLNAYLVEGMELFPAANKNQWEVIKERIDKSDHYVLIIAGRYGSIAHKAQAWEPHLVGPGEQVSFTQLEFRYARSKGKAVLAFIKQARENEEDGIMGFIKEVQSSDLTTAYWSSRADIAYTVLAGVNQAVVDRSAGPDAGWIRADSLTNPVDPGHGLVKLLSKTHYIKFISYASKASGAQPLYRKHIMRLKSDFDVWDEYTTVTVSQFSHCLTHMKFYARTDGDAVDFSVLHPYVDKLMFSDEKAGLHDKEFNPVIERPSNIYATGASYLNGFQDGNTDLGMKATDYPAKSLRMTADFTSVKGHETLFRLKRAVLRDPQGRLTDVSSFVQIVQPGVFTIECQDVPKDHVMRFDFDVQ